MRILTRKSTDRFRSITPFSELQIEAFTPEPNIFGIHKKDYTAITSRDGELTITTGVPGRIDIQSYPVEEIIDAIDALPDTDVYMLSVWADGQMLASDTGNPFAVFSNREDLVDYLLKELTRLNISNSLLESIK